MEEVDWYQVQRFVQLMSFFGRYKYRLPSEAEWEYAARGGNTSRQYSNNSDDDCASDRLPNCLNQQNIKGPVEVGTFKPNRVGLYDMLGNVAEWVQDCYVDSYRTTPLDGSANTTGPCQFRVVRGGAWDMDLLRVVTVTARNSYAPDNRLTYVGFRVVRTGML